MVKTIKLSIICHSDLSNRVIRHATFYSSWFFFVLSGFLISSQLFLQIKKGNGLSLRDFFIKRVFRILPIYFFIVAVYFFFEFCLTNGNWFVSAATTKPYPSTLEKVSLLWCSAAMPPQNKALSKSSSSCCCRQATDPPKALVWYVLLLCVKDIRHMKAAQ